jgi:adenylate cyclase
LRGVSKGVVVAGVERRLAAILAADAVGYSRLMGANETTTHTRLRQLQAGTVDPLAAQHHGRVVKLTGDGALMEFRSVVDAVHCAIAVQNAVAEREAESPQDQRIQFRIGINLGDVIVDGEDVYGDAVNIASRLEGLAEPSGIVVSDNAMQFLDEALRARFVDGGRHDLKNIERPIRIWRWLAQFDVRAQRKRLERPSVAVLPFDSLGPEPDQGYFADGITEDIITELARFRSLLVIDRKSSFAYRHRYVPASAAGRELGVHFVLSGSVRHIGNRLRINALLVSAATDEQVWGTSSAG